jgi:hypothetical protein
MVENWGTWESHEEEQLARWAALSFAERLAWLEEAKAFHALVEEARQSGSLHSCKDSQSEQAKVRSLSSE